MRFLDFDNDGWKDAFIVNGGLHWLVPMEPVAASQQWQRHVYRCFRGCRERLQDEKRGARRVFRRL